jgi:F-type H+-transporting ATPase subunit delta
MTVSASQTPKIIAGELAIVARRYAQAIVELAEGKNQVVAVEADLLALEEAVTGNVLFRKMASHPRLPKGEVFALIKNLAEQSKFCELTTAFLLHVARNHRLAQIGAILTAFKELLAVKRGQHTAYVTSAVALSQAQMDALSVQLGKMSGGTVQVVAQEDASLLGGLMIKMGSRLIDASVKGKLAQIERQLKTQQEAA